MSRSSPKEISEVVQDMWLSKLTGIPHATSRHSWKTRDLEFPVASVRRVTARLVAGQLDVSDRTWKVPVVWSTALEATEMQLHVVAASEVDTR
ncbi:unnamed protein product [Alternaria burnsii]|nr:unnamed protein product [Alternaria burnsii]